jgi:hypothetical protein
MDFLRFYRFAFVLIFVCTYGEDDAEKPTEKKNHGSALLREK